MKMAEGTWSSRRYQKSLNNFNNIPIREKNKNKVDPPIAAKRAGFSCKILCL